MRLKHIALLSTVLCALALPVSAQTPPRSPVLGIAPGATGTAANVTVQDGTGSAVPWLKVNPATHLVSHIGDGSLLAVVPTGGTVGRTMADTIADIGSVLGFGAKCDGSTDDTAAFVAALSTLKYVRLPAGKTCFAHDLSVTDHQTLDLNNAYLKAAPGASRLVTLTGYLPEIINGQIDDTGNVTLRSSTLTAAAPAGATSLTLSGTTGFAVGQLVQVTEANGFHAKDKITAISGATITIEHGLDSAAASGAAVQTAQALITVDHSTLANVRDIKSNAAPIAFAWINSTRDSGGDNSESTASDLQANGIGIAGEFLDVAVNTASFRHIHNLGSQTSGVGFYQSGTSSKYTSGGHTFFDMLNLGPEDGAILNNATLSQYYNMVNDTLGNRTLVVRDSPFGNLWFTDYYNGVAPNGVSITNSRKIRFDGLWSDAGITNNDLSIDSTSQVDVVDEAYGPMRRTIGTYNKTHSTSIGGAPLSEVVRVKPVGLSEPSGTEVNNKWEFVDNTPGNSPLLRLMGPDTSIYGQLQAKGGGGWNFYNDNNGYLGGIDGAGLSLEVPRADQANSYVQPASGATVSPSYTTSTLVVDPSAALSALTVALPSVFRDGQSFSLVCGQSITTLTITLPSANYARFPTSQSCSPTQGHEWFFRASGNTWFQRY